MSEWFSECDSVVIGGDNAVKQLIMSKTVLKRQTKNYWESRYWNQWQGFVWHGKINSHWKRWKEGYVADQNSKFMMEGVVQPAIYTWIAHEDWCVHRGQTLNLVCHMRPKYRRSYARKVLCTHRDAHTIMYGQWYTNCVYQIAQNSRVQYTSKRSQCAHVKLMGHRTDALL